jgi:MFS family permease
MVSIFSTWTGSAIITSYFAPILLEIGVKSPINQTGINGGLQIFNWFVAIPGSNLVDRVGRRKLWPLSGWTMLFALVMITIISSEFAQYERAAAGYSFIVFLFIFNFGYGIAYPALGAMYIAETCPYSLRAKGMSFFFVISYTAEFFNQYVNPIALQKIGWKYYTVYIPVILLSIILIWFFYPETKSLTVEEIALLFHGEGSEADPAVHALHPNTGYIEELAREG